MKYIVGLVLAIGLISCTKKHLPSTAEHVSDTRREQLVGDWTGGGALVPIHRTFCEDGN